MFYKCSPGDHRAVDVQAPAAKGRVAKRHFTVDIHCHVAFPEIRNIVAPFYEPEMEMFLKYMNQESIDVNTRPAGDPARSARGGSRAGPQAGGTICQLGLPQPDDQVVQC